LGASVNIVIIGGVEMVAGGASDIRWASKDLPQN
jgi:hypothetical protein